MMTTRSRLLGYWPAAIALQYIALAQAEPASGIWPSWPAALPPHSPSFRLRRRPRPAPATAARARRGRDRRCRSSRARLLHAGNKTTTRGHRCRPIVALRRGPCPARHHSSAGTTHLTTSGGTRGSRSRNRTPHSRVSRATKLPLLRRGRPVGSGPAYPGQSRAPRLLRSSTPTHLPGRSLPECRAPDYFEVRRALLGHASQIYPDGPRPVRGSCRVKAREKTSRVYSSSSFSSSMGSPAAANCW